VVVFHKLLHKDLTRIVELELAKVERRLREHGLKMEITPQAKDYLLSKGTDEKFGARPLRRAIEQLVEDPLSENILRGMYKGQNRIVVNVSGEGDQRKLSFDASDTRTEEERQLAAAASETT